MHPGREALRVHAGRYAPVVMDLFFDHLLARDWSRWHGEPLPSFAARMYDLLQVHEHLMPDRTRQMLPFMVSGDWLNSYASLEGLGRALGGLSRRVAAGADMAERNRCSLRTPLEFSDELNASFRASWIIFAAEHEKAGVGFRGGFGDFHRRVCGAAMARAAR
ncbi:MAG: DUF479 domain-containing protein [Flavobacteriales bacterium]|nr:DUF479 domain-containing protein [Flavobacteriales bacterium]